MTLHLGEEKLKSLILMIIPFCIFTAFDGTFSVQSILPMIILLILIDIMSKKIERNFVMLLTIGLFLISSIASIIINAFLNNDLNTNRTFIRIVYYSIILYFYYSVTRIKYNKEFVNKIINANILCAFIVSLYLIFVNHIWLINLLGTRIDKNFVGALLAIQGELAFINCLTKDKKLIYIISYLTIITGLFYSASRASLLVCLLGSFLILFFSFIANIKNKKKFIKIVAIFIVIPVILLVLYNTVFQNLLNSNATIQWYWNRYFVNGYDDSSVTGRWVWWKNGLELFKDRMIFGYGIGNINVSGNSSAVSHNTFLDFLIDQGVVGFTSFIIILFRTFINMIKNKKMISFPLILTLLLNIFILSATRSVYLWYGLILIYCIGTNEEIFNDKGIRYEKKVEKSNC